MGAQYYKAAWQGLAGGGLAIHGMDFLVVIVTNASYVYLVFLCGLMTKTLEMT